MMSFASAAILLPHAGACSNSSAGFQCAPVFGETHDMLARSRASASRISSWMDVRENSEHEDRLTIGPVRQFIRQVSRVVLPGVGIYQSARLTPTAGFSI